MLMCLVQAVHSEEKIAGAANGNLEDVVIVIACAGVGLKFDDFVILEKIEDTFSIQMRTTPDRFNVGLVLV